MCENLLTEPYTPEETTCEHHVCKGCKGGTKVLRPTCSWCKDYSKYSENVQLRILIQNYKKLCGLVKITKMYEHLLRGGEQGMPAASSGTSSWRARARGSRSLCWWRT